MNPNVEICYRDEDGEPSNPLDFQKEFHEALLTHTRVLCGGGFGAGKTAMLIIEAFRQSWAFENNQGVLGRKDMPRLTVTVIALFDEMCPESWIKNRNKKENWVEFKNGSKIFFMGLDNSKEAKEKIKGRNLGWFGLDQQEEISEDVYWALTTRLRRKNSARVGFGVMNRAGHDWNHRVWKKKDVKNPNNFYLVECQTEMNTHLTKDYIDGMDELPDRWKRKNLGRNWDNPIGLVFDNFRWESSKEIIDGKEVIHPANVISEKYLKDIPDYYFRFRSIDHGLTNPTACLFFARSPDGVNILYDMHYRTEFTIRENADAIKRKSYDFLEKGGVFKGNFGCRSLAKRQSTDKRSFADIYSSEHGLHWSIVYTNVGAAIDTMTDLIEQGKFIVVDRPSTQPFFEEILNWHWKDLKPQQEIDTNMPEVPVDKDNHAMEAAYNYCSKLTNVNMPTDDESIFVNTRIKDMFGKKQQKEMSWLS